MGEDNDRFAWIVLALVGLIYGVSLALLATNHWPT